MEGASTTDYTGHCADLMESCVYSHVQGTVLTSWKLCLLSCTGHAHCADLRASSSLYTSHEVTNPAHLTALQHRLWERSPSISCDLSPLLSANGFVGHGVSLGTYYCRLIFPLKSIRKQTLHDYTRALP